MLPKKLPQNSELQRTTNNISYEIKKLVAEKRTARSIWQRTHTLDSRRKRTEQATNLNQNSTKCGMNPLKNTSPISKGKITIWKPINNKSKPKTSSPQYANIHHLRDHRKNATRKKLTICRTSFRSSLST